MICCRQKRSRKRGRGDDAKVAKRGDMFNRRLGDCKFRERVEIGEGFVRKENVLRFGRIDLKKV